MCGASYRSIEIRPKECARAKEIRETWEQSYVPMPFLGHLIDPLEWIHILATLDVSLVPKPIQFCDEDGYDIVPIRMLRVYMDSDDTSSDNESSIKEYYEIDHNPKLMDYGGSNRVPFMLK